MTLILVLVVLPRRYVLHAGLRESGVSFPSAAAPFLPPQEELRDVPSPPPPPPEVLARGPAEAFWEEVGALLEEGRFAQAIPVFRRYLDAYPEDRGARREYAITLDRAFRSGEAVQVLEELLAEEDAADIRLLLARSLRDQGRLDAASVQYGILRAQRPDDVSLALEWARALAWGRQYDWAIDILTRTLAVGSDVPEVRVELARIMYWAGRVDEADAILAAVPEGMDEELDAGALRSDILAARTPAEPTGAPVQETVDTVALSALERAGRAVQREDHEVAEGLYAEALRENPEDAAAWLAYANLLQYHREDLEGARAALLRVEELTGGDAALRFRLAQLDVWTGRNEEAVRRLEALLGQLEVIPGATPTHPEPTTKPLPEPATDVAGAPPEGAGGFGVPETAEARAMLGDLYRWEGRRVGSGEAYQAALETDPENQRARRGLDELTAEADRQVTDLERPGLGTDVYSFADSDEFTRIDLGLEGSTIEGSWVWNARTGARLLRGLDLSGAEGREEGFFAEVEAARWWRWGTLRTGVHVGLEQVRPEGSDVSFGASLRWSNLGGFRADLRYDHGPAYPLTVTLESVFARVVYDRVTAAVARELGDRWSLSAAADAAWLDVNPDGNETGETADGDGSLRLEGGMSLGRALSEGLIVGANGRAVTYTDAAPTVGGRRLFWDPRAVVAGGLYAQWDRQISGPWGMRARLNPSLALIDERDTSGFEGVPHLSAELGIAHVGERVGATLDLFYYQGRMEGYRAYGLRLGISTGSWLGGGDRR